MLNKINLSISEELPFVIYSKPNSNRITGLFQKNNSLFFLDDFSKTGFVFSPFDDTQKSILIPFELSEFIEEEYKKDSFTENNTFDYSFSESDKKSFENLVQKMIHEINKEQISKIVASRKEEFNQENINIIELFQKMLSKYPNAFRYCFYHPKIGFWMGATPEKLLSVNNNILETMAYAGTQKLKDSTNVVWEEKEKQEQQFVTDFIVNTLESEAEKIELSEPFTSQAGTLLHIRTDIKVILKNDFSLDKIIKKLHPTPAVCGLPKDLAKQFILNHEGYNRKFYSGFLGELNFGKSKTSELFVNLRCMEIQNKKVSLYIGCGITKDSNPENEFFETVNKSITMKSLF